jgi:trimeric autotransporter adhesin
MLTGRKLPLTLAFMVLIGLAVGAGCRGFFVKPNLTQVAVGPATPTIQTGTTNNTQQFTAFGTFDDGSHSNPAVTWSSSDDTVATISASGLATAVARGTSTITATAVQNPTVTGTTTLTVTVGCISKIDVTPLQQTIPAGTTFQFTAKATTCTGVVDITNVAKWVSSNTNAATINSTGLATSITAGTATNITAASAGVTSPAAVLTVSP